MRDSKQVLIAAAVSVVMFVGGIAGAAELYIGAATVDITPDGPVALTGMQTVRLSQRIHSRCTANVLALESREGERVSGRPRGSSGARRPDGQGDQRVVDGLAVTAN